MDGGNAYSQVSLTNSRRYAGLPSKESSVLRDHQLLNSNQVIKVRIVYLRYFLMDMGMVPTV